MTAGTRRERVKSRNFMVGLFLPTMSGGWTVSHATNLETYRYKHMRELALMADHFEFDYLFAGGGYMPKITRAFKFRDRMTDAVALTAALGAITTYPMVISTVHVLYRHAPPGDGGYKMSFHSWLGDYKDRPYRKRINRQTARSGVFYAGAPCMRQDSLPAGN